MNWRRRYFIRQWDILNLLFQLCLLVQPILCDRHNVHLVVITSCCSSTNRGTRIVRGGFAQLDFQPLHLPQVLQRLLALVLELVCIVQDLVGNGPSIHNGRRFTAQTWESETWRRERRGRRLRICRWWDS
jgi:hypothetical protein